MSVVRLRSRVGFCGNLRLDGLGDGTNLVNLEQETVAGLLLDGGLDSERVGDSEIVTNDLDAGRLVQVGPSLPVVLVEGVLDGDNVVLLDVALVDVTELLSGEPLGLVGVGVLDCGQPRKVFKIRKVTLTLKSRSYLPSL